MILVRGRNEVYMNSTKNATMNQYLEERQDRVYVLFMLYDAQLKRI